MNLLLIDPGELRGDGTCTIFDRRAHHLRTVIGVEVGSTVRAGLLGGAIGTAEVISDDGSAYTFRLNLVDPPPKPLAVELLLAVPRPKVITRTIEIATSFAVKRIDLTNAWRVDKSYLRSPRLDPGAHHGPDLDPEHRAQVVRTTVEDRARAVGTQLTRVDQQQIHVTTLPW